ncbi:MAG: hypothetical protein OHK0029_32830 [Armatimonadaceae bacterium]
MTMQLNPITDPFADRRLWTRDECRKMEVMGLLEPGRYELLDGIVVLKSSINEAHMVTCMKTYLALVMLYGAEHVRLPGPVALNEQNEPVPDFAITARPDEDYPRPDIPPASDIRLILEVSDTTFWRDATTKARIYARAEIPEYWVLHVPRRVLLSHRQPCNGEYIDIQEHTEATLFAPLSLPNKPFSIADLLP